MQLRWMKFVMKTVMSRKHLFVATVVGSTIGVAYLNRHFLEMRVRGNLAKLPNIKERVSAYLQSRGLIVRDYSESSGLFYKETDEPTIRSFMLAVDDPSGIISTESMSRVVTKLVEELDRDAA